MERRQFERVAIRGDAELRRNGIVARVPIVEISSGGAYLAVPLSEHIDLKTGARFALTLTIHEEMPCHAEEYGSTVHVTVRIVRRDPGGDGRPAGLGGAFARLDLENRGRIEALVGRRDD